MPLSQDPLTWWKDWYVCSWGGGECLYGGDAWVVPGSLPEHQPHYPQHWHRSSLHQVPDKSQHAFQYHPNMEKVTLGNNDWMCSGNIEDKNNAGKDSINIHVSCKYNTQIVTWKLLILEYVDKFQSHQKLFPFYSSICHVKKTLMWQIVYSILSK